MEQGGAAPGGVGADGAEGLEGGDFVALAHEHLREVAVDGDVAAMSHEDMVEPAELEDGHHAPGKDGAGLCAGLALDVDAFAVEAYAAESGYVVLTEVAHHDAGAREGHGQASAMGGEVATEPGVGGSGWRRGGGGGALVA